jgi:hypothetical protein
MAGRQGFLSRPSRNSLAVQRLDAKPLKACGLPESIPSRLSLLLFAVLGRTDTKTDTILAGRLEIEALIGFT